MTIVSAPKASEKAIVGADYNPLREDVLVNHQHKGNYTGTQVDHNDLLNGGDHGSHDTLASDISALKGKTLWRSVQFGILDVSGGGAAWQSDDVVFDPPMVNSPVIITNWEQRSTFREMHPVNLGGVSNLGFTAHYIDDEALGTPADMLLHWVAFEPA